MAGGAASIGAAQGLDSAGYRYTDASWVGSGFPADLSAQTVTNRARIGFEVPYVYFMANGGVE